MLRATLRDGRSITPAMYPRDKLQELKARQENFYCPVCKEKVILKAGEKVIAHFAHLKKEKCLIGGGEGAYHEQGKLHIYQWLEQQGLSVQLEAYLPEIEQRPDILLEVNNRKIAIEYQCSRIPREEIINRTLGYKQAGINVVWIIGERLMKRRASGSLSVDSFTQTMMHQFSPDYPLSLFFYCPVTKRVIKFQHLTFTRKTHAFGRLSVEPLNRLTFPRLLQKEFFDQRSFHPIWKREKQRFRLRRRSRPFGEEREWLGWLYEKGIRVDGLPAIVHLPVSAAYQIKSPGWIWQSRIVIDVIDHKRLGAPVTLHECRRLLRTSLLPHAQFPLIQTPLDPILQYLKLLTRAGILEATSNPHVFKKTAPFSFPETIEDALTEDNELMDMLYLKK